MPSFCPLALSTTKQSIDRPVCFGLPFSAAKNHSLRTSNSTTTTRTVCLLDFHTLRRRASDNRRNRFLVVPLDLPITFSAPIPQVTMFSVPNSALGILCMLALVSIPTIANAVSLQYCSSQNTGSGFAAINYHWQSGGECHDTCLANYAFAIVQGQNCWCSNYAADDVTSLWSCNEPCPGYPYEYCGSTSAGLFGYIALDNAPSGTLGLSTSSTRSTVVSSTPQSIATIVSTSTILTPSSSLQASPTQPSDTSSSTSVSPSSTLSIVVSSAGSPVASSSIYVASSSATSVVSSPPAPTTLLALATSPTVTSSYFSATTWVPTTIAAVTTVGGVIVTQLVTQTIPVPAVTSVVSVQAAASGTWAPAWKPVLLVSCLALFFIFLAGLIIVFLRKKIHWIPPAFLIRSKASIQRHVMRRNPEVVDNSITSHQPAGRPLSWYNSIVGSVRRQETLSNQAEAGRQPIAAVSDHSPMVMNTRTNSDLLQTAISRRSSAFMPIDHRLDPGSVFGQHSIVSNSSQLSFTDNVDYSRRLRVTNPDE